MTTPARATSALAAAVLAMVALHLAAADRYHVHGAAISGNQRVPAEAIYAAGGFDGSSVFRLEPVVIAERIEALPDVKHAEARIALPARVWIAVEETRPVLLWRSGGGLLAVDEYGRAINPPPDQVGLVEVHDLSEALNSPGDRLPSDLVAAGLAYGSRFGRLVYRAGDGFIATTREGWEVRLGTDADLLVRQAATLEALRVNLASERRAVAFIDLRFAYRPYYRLQGEGE